MHYSKIILDHRHRKHASCDWPSATLRRGTLYRDLVGGNFAIIVNIEDAYTVHLAQLQQPKSLCIGINHVLAEWNIIKQFLWQSLGKDRTFSITLNYRHVHPKIEHIDSTLQLICPVDGITYIVADDGEGNLVCDHDILGNPQENTVDYESGLINLKLKKPPDVCQMYAYYEYGATRVTRKEDIESELPYIIDVADTKSVASISSFDWKSLRDKGLFNNQDQL